jgi:hypothetical protein
MMWLLAGILGFAVFVVGLAVLDVFWPFTVGVVAYGIAVWWLSLWPTLAPYLQPPAVAAYFAAGCLWVFFKWSRLVERKWREAKHNKLASQAPPTWAEHQYGFAAYFFYWPIDVVAYVLSDVLTEAWRLVSSMVSQSFNRYAQWRFNRLESK